MEIYTISLQFRVEADDEAGARRQAEMDYDRYKARVVTEPVILVHHYETVPDKDGE